jgi:hypothetical protein
LQTILKIQTFRSSAISRRSTAPTIIDHPRSVDGQRNGGGAFEIKIKHGNETFHRNPTKDPNMGRLLTLAALASATALAFAAPASAQVVEDPLHGCTTSGCTETSVGGNLVTPIGTVSNFGFTASPADSGDLVLKFLIPDNFALSTVQAFAAAVSVTGTSTSNLTLFSTTPWTSGQLESTYLGITSFANGSPPNPLSAWIGATQTLQPGANGYYVLLADMGQYSLPTPGNPLPDVFSLTSGFYASGGLIVADLFTGPNHTLDVTTAQSGALFYNGLSSGPFCTGACAVPGPIVGAGLPGLLSACIGLVLLAKRRRRERLSA